MTTELISKINEKSKQEKFKASRDYRSNARSCVPYKEYVVVHEEHPNKFFLVHENMIFERNSICDSSYDVWSFDEKGNLLQKENMEELGGKFFWKTKVIYNL